MNYTKDKVIDAILFFAKKYDLENNYKAIIEQNATVPELIKMIIYQMFLNSFNSYYSTDTEYSNYKIIYEYSTEMNLIGYVKYGK